MLCNSRQMAVYRGPRLNANIDAACTAVPMEML